MISFTHVILRLLPMNIFPQKKTLTALSNKLMVSQNDGSNLGTHVRSCSIEIISKVCTRLRLILFYITFKNPFLTITKTSVILLSTIVCFTGFISYHSLLCFMMSSPFLTLFILMFFTGSSIFSKSFSERKCQ